MNFKALHRLAFIVGIIFVLTGCASDESRTSRVVLSVGDKILSLSELQYQLPVVVQVAELDGEAIPNATVSISLRTIGFDKGFYQVFDTTVPPDGTGDILGQTTLASCAAEDVNNNGALDAGEDVNGNGFLEPHTPSITAHSTETPTLTPGTRKLVTDDNGFGYFTITYPKAEATWVDVELTASVSGGRPENRAQQTFRLLVLKSELEEIDVFHPFSLSPYGVSANCSDAD